MKELKNETALVAIPREDAVDPEVLSPDHELMFSHLGLLGSAGGFSGFGPTWQKPHDMPTRYGFTSLASL